MVNSVLIFYAPYVLKIMKNGLSQKNLLLLPVLISLLIWHCSEKNDQIEINRKGKVYSYRKIEHKITDLEKEPINTSWVETEHCVLQYCNEYEEKLQDLVVISEDAYEKVAQDLKLRPVGIKIKIYFFERNELKRIWASEELPVGFFTPGANIIGIDMDRGKLDPEFVGNYFKLVTHEMTHFFLSDLIRLTRGRADAVLVGAFSEGLCLYEGKDENELGDLLVNTFPEGDFLSFEEIGRIGRDLSKSNICSLEFAALIMFLKDFWGEDVLVSVVHSLKQFTFQETIEKYTLMPINEFQEKWFQYMRDLIVYYKAGNPAGGFPQEENVKKN